MKLNNLLPLLGAAIASACDIPDGPPLSNNITQGFGVRVQNPEFPIVHNRYLNLEQAGGGDRHLYLNPAGEFAFDLLLTKGVIQRNGSTNTIFAVINGEVSQFICLA
jgi:kremen protein